MQEINSYKSKSTNTGRVGFVFCIELWMLALGLRRYGLQIVVGLETIWGITEATVKQKLYVECDIQGQIILKPKKVFSDGAGLECSTVTTKPKSVDCITL